MSTYAPITLWTRGDRGHFIVSPHPLNPHPPCWTVVFAAAEPSPVMSHFSIFPPSDWPAYYLLSEVISPPVGLAWQQLTAFICSCIWMRLFLRYCWCGCAILFIYPLTFLKKKKNHLHVDMAWSTVVMDPPHLPQTKSGGTDLCQVQESEGVLARHPALNQPPTTVLWGKTESWIPKWRLNHCVKQKQHGGIIF